MGTRRTVLITTNLLLLGIILYLAWQAHGDIPQSLAETTFASSEGRIDRLADLLAFPAMFVFYISVAMMTSTLLATWQLQRFAAHHPHYLSLPSKTLFLALPTSSRTDLMRIVGDFLQSICLLGLGLITLLQWQLMNFSTDPDAVLVNEYNTEVVAISVAATLVLLAIASVLFTVEFKRQVAAITDAQPVPRLVAAHVIDTQPDPGLVETPTNDAQSDPGLVAVHPNDTQPEPGLVEDPTIDTEAAQPPASAAPRKVQGTVSNE